MAGHAGYTLKLDLSSYEHSVLLLLLKNDSERSAREGTSDSPWAVAVAKMADEIYGYDEAVDMARRITASDDAT